jgi:hypothetical protein
VRRALEIAGEAQDDLCRDIDVLHHCGSGKRFHRLVLHGTTLNLADSLRQTSGSFSRLDVAGAQPK